VVKVDPETTVKFEDWERAVKGINLLICGRRERREGGNSQQEGKKSHEFAAHGEPPDSSAKSESEQSGKTRVEIVANGALAVRGMQCAADIAEKRAAASAGIS
jgi:hypothetical protein